jgi:hypothetical protein
MVENGIPNMKQVKTLPISIQLGLDAKIKKELLSIESFLPKPNGWILVYHLKSLHPQSNSQVSQR